MSDNQKFFLSFFLICLFSLSMHVFLVRKGAIQQYRYEPIHLDATPSRNQVRTVEGRVTAVGFDRFHLQVGDRRMTFLVEGVPMPAVGSRLQVRYQDGDPPKVLDLAVLRTEVDGR
ncbi:MAG: hypothetical protein HY319_12385 [Armatimonadetes bacterium]|nr:hypothetical protein [Armatimonadota bacterium]